MRPKLLVVALLMCALLRQKASAQAAQGGGPTLAETMAFLNETLQQRGTLQYSSFTSQYYSATSTISMEGFSGTGCEQTYRSEIAGNKGKVTVLGVLKLDQADVSSVAILEPDTAESRTVFAVAVNKIAYSKQVMPQSQPTVEVGPQDADQRLLRGRVQSADATSVTFLPDNSGTARRFTPDKSTKFYFGDDSQGPKAKMADIQPGDALSLFLPYPGLKKNYEVWIKKIPGATAPVLPDPGVLLATTRQVGPERKQFVFGYSKDREGAERIAKAIIHAMVLCQGNAKPSLF